MGHGELSLDVVMSSLACTPTEIRRRRTARAGILGAFVALGSLFFMGASPVHAETTLVSSTPADGEEVIASPVQIVAVFSAAVPNNAFMQAVCNGQPAPIGVVTVGADGVSLIAPLTAALPIGTCNVSYSVPQADGNVATGGFSFEVLDPSSVDPGDTSAADSTEGPVDAPPVSGPLGLFRMIAYAALAALFGGAALIVWIWPEGFDDSATHRYFKITWSVAFVSSYVVVALQASLTSGKSVAQTLVPLISWGELFKEASGLAVLLRLFLVMGCLIFAFHPDRLVDPQSKNLSLGLSGAAMATFAFTRASLDFSILGTAAALVHNLSIALWFGGLIFLAQTVLIAPGGDDLMAAIRHFSRRSLLIISVTVISGVVHLYQLDGGAILTSRHGRLVILKVFGVVAMVYIGGATRQFISRGLAKKRQLDGRTAAKLRRFVLTEAAFGVFVLALTSWSVATLPDKAPPPGSDRTDYAFVSDRSGGGFDVQLNMTPALVGRNAVRIDVYSPGSGLTDLTVQFNPPTNNVASVTLNVPIDGAASAKLPFSEGVPLNTPGLWTIIVTGNGPDGPLPSVTYTVSILANTSETPVNEDVNTTTSTIAGGVSSPATVVVPLGETTVPSSSGVRPVTATVVTTTP